jgi:quinol monooxygenase YgiN
MAKISLKGFIIVPDMSLAIIRQELPVHIELTRKETGCLVFEVIPAENNPNRFDVYEEFASKADFEAHQVRVKNSRWGQVTSGVERYYGIIE